MRVITSQNATTKTRRHEGIPFLLGAFAASSLLLLFVAFAAGVTLYAQGDGGYRLVPNWPKLPAGTFFGLKDAPPPPAEREAQAAARRARGGSTGTAQTGASGGGAMAGGPTNQPGISGLAIDAQDHIYVFNRGAKPVMIFDRDGNLILAQLWLARMLRRKRMVMEEMRSESNGRTEHRTGEDVVIIVMEISATYR